MSSSAIRPSSNTVILDYINSVKLNTDIAKKFPVGDISKINLNNYGFIYVIHAVGANRYKIGRTKNLQNRFLELKKQSPFPLEVYTSWFSIDCVLEELLLHKKFRLSRRHGEWFELVRDENQINELQSNFNRAVNCDDQYSELLTNSQQISSIFYGMLAGFSSCTINRLVYTRTGCTINMASTIENSTNCVFYKLLASATSLIEVANRVEFVIDLLSDFVHKCDIDNIDRYKSADDLYMGALNIYSKVAGVVLFLAKSNE